MLGGRVEDSSWEPRSTDTEVSDKLAKDSLPQSLIKLELKKVNVSATMRIGCLIKTTKCQLLGISLTVMFLGVAVAALTLWTSFSDEFNVIRNITIETNRYNRFHDLAVYSGLSTSIFLALLGIICLIGIVKESEYLLSVVSSTLFGIYHTRYSGNKEQIDCA
ncbi:hypothetical protein scyTo_0019225 [Scyliorhinus torazame]|uniref:Uncharacterized protein n=1 Tax=Scyliorhinus torazame TaxID=75743 RepID=A0A401PV82_SCYTO|nr:hypothetical protein [Scyliorhinus torazame]